MTREVDRLFSGAHLADELLLGDLREQLAELRTARDRQRIGQLVAAQQRLRRVDAASRAPRR